MSPAPAGGWQGLGIAVAVAKGLFYAVLIILCLLLAPEEPLKFIYTEF